MIQVCQLAYTHHDQHHHYLYHYHLHQQLLLHQMILVALLLTMQYVLAMTLTPASIPGTRWDVLEEGGGK